MVDDCFSFLLLASSSEPDGLGAELLVSVDGVSAVLESVLLDVARLGDEGDTAALPVYSEREKERNNTVMNADLNS